MRLNGTKTMAMALALVALEATIARAQVPGWQLAMAAEPPSGGTISGTGMVTVERPAAVLRMLIELSGKGKTLEEAMARLNDRREAAVMQLESMKARKESITATPPSLSMAEAAQRSRLEQMIRTQMSGRGRAKPKGLEVPKSAVAVLTLTAEWPLAAKDPDALLVETEAIKEKVLAADLAGAKQAQEQSLEEQELTEEMAQMMNQYGSEEKVEPGTPHFLFVARITDEDRKKAMAEAFQKAKAQAAELAAAAGVSLGPLAGLSGQAQGNAGLGDDGDMFGPSEYALRAYFQRLAAQSAGRKSDPNETIAGSPDALKFVFVVRANFSVGK